jgi:hypothetical protein
MTVSTTNRKDQYTGSNGIGQNMSVTFIFFVSSDLTVTERTTATGADVTLTEGVDYTVAGGSSTGATGTVTTVAAVPATKTWTISRDIPRTQPTDLALNGPLPSDTLETMVDRVVLQSQEDSETVGRALSFPVTDSDSLDATLPDSVSRASMSLGFDASGNPIALAGTVSGDVTVNSFMEPVLQSPSAGVARAQLVAQEDVVTTRGDLVIGDSSGNADRLAIGTTAGTVLMTDGTDPAYTELPLPAGWLVGFEMENRGAATTTDINIFAGQSRSTGDVGNIKSSATMTKEIDNPWAAGTQAGGFPTGITIANGTWYHVFVIATPAGVMDAGFDSSPTAANLLHGDDAGGEGYTLYRRIGSVKTLAGASTIEQFKQHGDWFSWSAGPPLLNYNDRPTTGSALVTLSVPPNVFTVAKINVFMNMAVETVSVYLHPTDVTIGTVLAPGTTEPILFNVYCNSASVHGDDAQQMEIIADEASQVRIEASATPTNEVRISTGGWTDQRGKNAL